MGCKNVHVIIKCARSEPKKNEFELLRANMLLMNASKASRNIFIELSRAKQAPPPPRPLESNGCPLSVAVCITIDGIYRVLARSLLAHTNLASIAISLDNVSMTYTQKLAIKYIKIIFVKWLYVFDM